MALIVGFAQLVFLFNLVWSLLQGQACRRQSLARHDAGVADARDAAGARQLGQGAAGGLSLGLRLQRAGCRAGLRAAEPAAGRRQDRHRRRRPWRSPSAFLARGRGDRRLVAVAAAAGGQALAGGGRRSATCRPQARRALPAAKIGLGVFLAVAGSLFALFVSAYLMRMHMGTDWRPLPVPTLLWLNTGVLVAEQRGAAPGAGRRAPRPDGRRAGRPARRGRARRSRSWPGSSWPGAQLDRRRLLRWRPTRPTPSSTCSPRCTGCTCWAAWWPWARTIAKVLARRRDRSEVRLSVELCADLLALPAPRLAGPVRAAAASRSEDVEADDAARARRTTAAALATARRAGGASSPTGRRTSARSRTSPGGRP